MWAYNRASQSESNELYHYGVLGMKWGVRRNQRDKVYAKAKKKMDKLDDKANKAVAKKLKRANPVIRTEISDARYENAARKADKAISKASSWYKKVEKVLGQEDARRMTSSSYYSPGKDYADRLLKR